MSTQLGLTAGLAEREDISVYIKRAHEERSKAIRELFGFGFAVAKSTARDLTEEAKDVARLTPNAGRPA
jgi:hypothetical protein